MWGCEPPAKLPPVGQVVSRALPGPVPLCPLAESLAVLGASCLEYGMLSRSWVRRCGSLGWGTCPGRHSPFFNFSLSSASGLVAMTSKRVLRILLRSLA